MEFTVINPAPEKPTGYYKLEPGKLFRDRDNGVVFLVVKSFDVAKGYQIRFVCLKTNFVSSPLGDGEDAETFSRDQFEEVIPAGSIELRRL